jgi:hypothetical protein
MLRAERSTSAARLALALGRLVAVSNSSVVGNEAAQCPQVCSVWHNFKSKRTWIGRERGQKQTCLFCYA